MPKHLTARLPLDGLEERQVRKLAHSVHAPADWIVHAQLVARSWDGLRTRQIADELGCHPQTVRDHLRAFTARGLDGLGMKPGSGRKPRLTEGEPEWTLDTLTAAARDQGIQVARSQVRRIFRREGVRWRRTRLWATSKDPDFAPRTPPKGPASSRSTPLRLPRRPSSVSTNSAR